MLHRFRKAFVLLVSLCMVLGVSVFLAACGENTDPPTAVDQTTIQYDGYIITWAGADRATKYDLTINGNPYSSGGTSYAYPCESFPADVYSITITASNQYGSAEPTSKNFTRIPSIEKETINFSEEGEMSWMSVSGALSYEVEVNGAVKETATTTFSDFVYGGSNRIRIRPRGADGTFSIWSDTISKTYLNSPSNVSYDNQFISWRGDTSAKGYNVYIDGAKHNLEPITDTKYLFDSASNDFSVEVRAEGDGVDVFPSKMSEKIEYTYLGTAENVRVEEGILKWENSKAVSFLVRVSGEPDKVVTEPEYKLPAGVSKTIKILPQGKNSEHTFASWSPEESYRVLAAPQPRWDNSIAVEDGENHTNLVWDATSVGGVQGYKVRYYTPGSQAAQHYETTAENPGFPYNFPEAGVYRVSVQTVAVPNGDTYDSAYCDEFTIIRLAAPTLPANNVTSDATDLASGFSVRFGSVSGAVRYRLYKNGTATEQYAQAGATSLSVKDGLTLENESEMATIDFSLQSIGGGISGRTVTLSSITSANTHFDIRILPMPKNDTIEGGIFKWDSIADARGYSVLVESRTHVSNSEFSLATITSVGDHTVSVCAEGDGAALLPSPYTAALTVNKLRAPAYVTVDTGENEGVLSWDQVQNAQSYNFYLDGSNNPEKDDHTINITQGVSKQTTTVIVEAVANYWNNDVSHDVYYLTSERSITYTFTKLAAPTFGNRAFTNSELLWNAPSNANTAAITYTIYDNTNMEMASGVDATRWSTVSLAGGKGYTFKVRAISGEATARDRGTAFINSDFSDTVTIWKLATPVVTRSKTAYTWSEVGQAENYVVRIDGVLAQTIPGNSGEYSYAPSFKQASETTKVEIVAVGNGINDGTIDSTPCEITQIVRKLTNPDLKLPTYDANSKTVTATVTSPVPNADGYRFFFNGVVQVQKTESLTCTYQPQNKGEIGASVMALGGVFDEQDVFWLDSDTVGNNVNTTIYLLGTPTVSDISLTSGGQIKWKSVDNCMQYRLKVTYSNGNTVTVEPGTIGQGQTSYMATAANMQNNKPEDITKIELQAVGNGTTTFDSDWATWNR